MATSELSPGPSPSPAQTAHKPSCVVTFGRSTLLGRHLAAAAAASGRWATVAVVDPSPSPPPASLPLVHFTVDLSDAALLATATAGVSAVFHVDPTAAAAAAGDGSFLSLHRLAVEGTRRLLAACWESGVGRVVYTGSADVVLAGAGDVVDADEDATRYPDQFGDAVRELQAQVEMMVLSADGKNGMRTCALRPSNLFGLGDSSLVRLIAGYARSPFGKFVIGNGSNMCDFTYVENVAHANICAEQALRSNAASVAGKPFFVTNDEPIETWEFISCIMEAMGCQRPNINLPSKILLIAALFSKMINQMLDFQMFPTPLLDPDTIYFLSCTRTFNTSKARKLLGYSPVVSLEDGMVKTAGALSEPSAIFDLSRKQESRGLSKADKLLGSGTAADILLWRDEKKTFSCVTIMILLFYWLLLSDRTFVSSAAKILLVISMALFIHGVLPSSMFGFTIAKVSSDYFEVSQSTMRSSFMCLASIWNKGIHVLRVLAKGDDWNILFKVVASLYFMKLVIYFPFTILVGLVLASLFLVFIVYEQCEEEIDRFATIASVNIKLLKDRIVGNLPASLKAYIS